LAVGQHDVALGHADDETAPPQRREVAPPGDESITTPTATGIRLTLRSKSSYSVHMSTTITIRAAERLREVLDKKAAASGKTVSALVREILEEALAARPLRVRAGHLKGVLRLPRKSSGPWRRDLRQRNWRS
jgi:hypothetical protein